MVIEWLLSAVLLALVPFETPPAPPQIVPVPHDGKAPAPAPTPQPAPIPTSVRVSGAEFEMLTLVGYTGSVAWDVTSDSFGVPVKLIELKPKQVVIGVRAGSATPDAHEAPDTPSVAVFAVNTGRAVLSAWGVKESKPVKLATFTIDAGLGPRPPPDDKKDDKKPDDKKPEVVTSFRVIWVYESGDTFPPNQTAIMDAKAVRDYLNAKTTPHGGWAGWRQFDPQQKAENETPAMKALWQAVQPQLTTIPCLVVEVNGKAEIIPFPKSPADALVTLRSYGGP